RRVQLIVTENGSDIPVWLELEPLETAGLLRRESIEANDTKHGVTLGLRGIAIGEEASVVDLEVNTTAYIKLVQGIGARSGMRRGPAKMRIRDDQGREFVEF